MSKICQIKSDNRQIIPFKYKAELKAGSITVNGFLTLPIQFNLDNGIISGLIEIGTKHQNDIGILAMYHIPSDEFPSIENCMNTYVGVSKSISNTMIIHTSAKDFTFHNVYLNRYKSDEVLFHFIAQASIEELKEFTRLRLPLDKG